MSHRVGSQRAPDPRTDDGRSNGRAPSPHPETKIARVATGSAAPRRAELGRAARFSSLVAAPGHGGLIRDRRLSAVLLRGRPKRVTSQTPDVHEHENGITPFDCPRDNRPSPRPCDSVSGAGMGSIVMALLRPDGYRSSTRSAQEYPGHPPGPWRRWVRRAPPLANLMCLLRLGEAPQWPSISQTNS
jgi:hypothetical protein